MDVLAGLMGSFWRLWWGVNQGILHSHAHMHVLFQEVRRCVRQETGVVISARDSDVNEAAEYILSHSGSKTITAVATRALGLPVLREAYSSDQLVSAHHYLISEQSAKVAFLRKRLHSYPENAIAWIDLARAYTILGHIDAGRRAIKIALSLTSENRFVLRSAARFFYVAKASKKERGEDNNHPTVKPIALMEYLCRLTMTPKGGVVFDPFMGSGSTGIACARVGRRFVGAENDTEHGYFAIAKKRISNAYKKH